jgi:hypothetical protein
MNKEALEALIETLDKWSLMFTLLVVLGVGGELVVHWIQSKANQRLASLQRAETTAQETTIAKLNKDAADSKSAQQMVEIELAKQQERTARAEKDLLELQEHSKPRRLSEEQKQKLVELLSTQTPITPYISRSMDAPDGHAFAQDFEDVFRRLRWPFGPENSSSAIFNVHIIGVFVVVKNNTGAVPQAAAMQRALKSIGIQAHGAVDPNIPENTFEIRIGGRD